MSHPMAQSAPLQETHLREVACGPLSSRHLRECGSILVVAMINTSQDSPKTSHIAVIKVYLSMVARKMQQEDTAVKGRHISTIAFIIGL